MHFSSIVLAAAAGAALTVAHPGAIYRSASCSTPDGSGICREASDCGGYSVAGLCPSATGHECCVQRSCSTSSGSGVCKNIGSSCSAGTFIAEGCPGDSSIGCCVRNLVQQRAVQPSPSQKPIHSKTTASHTHTATSTHGAAVDFSTAKDAAFFTCLKKTHDKVAIKGYGQACGVGGAVNKNFVTSYTNAAAAGFTNIDAYLYPCTGTQKKGRPKCKEPATQLAEFEAAIAGAGMNINYRWFDVEPVDPGAACNAWNLGMAENLALAQNWTALLRDSGNTWGIYGNGNQWTRMFASRTTDIGSDLPLWAVQADQKPGVSTVTTFMGGWTSAVGKQFSEQVTVCGSGVDLDSFSV
ncbi:hypothetical protein MMC13_007650 [Lambiella insularis]|nr:hypothetical protein [Lambiella insularis]